MKEIFHRAYPLGGRDYLNVDADRPRTITYPGTSGVLDAKEYETNALNILLTSSSEVEYTIRNPNIGTMYIIEAAGAGVNDRTITLENCTYNETESDTVVLQTQNSSVTLLCVSENRYTALSAIGVTEMSGVEPVAVTKVTKSERVTLTFDSDSTFNIGAALPAGATVNDVIIRVVEEFDGVTESTLKIGDSSVDDRLCTASDVYLTSLDEYTVDIYYKYITETQIVGTYNQDGATQGIAYIEIFYSIL